jgi:hypothetical protein
MTNVVSLTSVRKLVARKKAANRTAGEQELLDAVEKLIALADDHSQRLDGLEQTLHKTLKLLATSQASRACEECLESNE